MRELLLQLDLHSPVQRHVRRAFSLFELTLSLAIIGVLAAIATPRYNNSIARYRVDLAARRMVADIRLAQSTARVTSAATSVIFTADQHLYQVSGVTNPYKPKQPFVVTLNADPHWCSIRKVDLAGKTQIDFNGYGIPSSGGSIVIESANAQRPLQLSRRLAR